MEMWKRGREEEGERKKAEEQRGAEEQAGLIGTPSLPPTRVGPAKQQQRAIKCGCGLYVESS